MTQQLKTPAAGALLVVIVLTIGGPAAGASTPASAGRAGVAGGGSGRAGRGLVAATASVRLVQRRLGIPADGVFGPATTAEVERFQRAHGLSLDGVVGAATWAALGVRGRHPVLAGVGPRSGAAAPAGQGKGAAGTSVVGSSPAAPASTAGLRPASAGVLAGASVAPATSSGGPALGSPPTPVALAVAAADRIASLPYVWGGGHAAWDASGYDCSGSVSYVLHAAGALSSPEDSAEFETYGAAGPGRWITIYASPDHVFMTIGSLRFDTSGATAAGSRWQPIEPAPAGYAVRHPGGL